MDLGSVFSRDQVPTETFLAVKVSQSDFMATTWHVEEGKVVVGSLGVGQINDLDQKSMLESADSAISKVLDPQDEKIHKVIFGLNPEWIFEGSPRGEAGKIVPEKLSFLQHICKEISLSPLGFVPVSEAIENFLKETEGAPLTAVLIGVDKDKGWVTLYRAGKNQGTESISLEEMISGDICAGIEKCLKKFPHVDVLPARMIIYDGLSQLELLEKKITAYPWTKQLPFLHFPKVEVMTGEMVVKAVAIAGGTQMGGEIEEVQNELEEVSAAQAGFFPELVVKSNSPVAVKESVPVLLNLKEKIKGIKFPRPNFNFNFKKSPKILPLMILATVVILGILGTCFYFIPQVKAIVHVTSKSFNREMEINATGQTVEATEIGTKKGEASGKKLVGEKAKGTVTIGNPAEARTFIGGTVLTSKTGQKFVLVGDVQIASGSGVLALATTTAPVVAAEIGEQYNIASGTLFSIANFSGQGKNDSVFSGGNSHQATVVTKQDQDRLVASLSAELTAKANGDLEAKLTPGQKLLSNAITSSVSKKKFSKDIDSEADTVSLDMTVDYKGVVASNDDIVNNFLSKFPNEIPSGYKIVEDVANINIKNTKLDKVGNVVMTVNLTAKFLPEIDTAKIIKEISGKSQNSATDLVKKLTGVTSVEFETKPKFFNVFTNLFLPFRNNAIKLEVVSD